MSRGKHIHWSEIILPFNLSVKGIKDMYYYIICSSLTYAQRTAAALERAGISTGILRSPKMVASEGCSHSVKIPQRKLSDALGVLAREGLTPKRIYVTADGEHFQEVKL